MRVLGNFLRSVAGILTSPSGTFKRVLAEKDVTQAGGVLIAIAVLEFFRIVLAQIMILYQQGYAEVSAIFVPSHPLSVLILVALMLIILPRVKGRLGYAGAPEFQGLLVMAGFASSPLLLLSVIKFALPGFGVRMEAYLPAVFELWYVYLLSLGLNIYLYDRASLKSIAIGMVLFMLGAFISGLLAFFFLLATRDALALI